MKDQESVQKFIELRSQGVSFNRIAAQLGVAKGTLVNWSQKYQHLIQNLRTIEWEDFTERTLVARPERLKALADQLRRLETELAGRDLSSIPTPQLHSMTEQLRRRLERECGTLQFSVGVELHREDETREAVQEWNP